MKKMTLICLSVMLSAMTFGCASLTGDKDGGGNSDIMVNNDGATCLDPVSGLTWQINRSGLITTIDEARNYAENLELGGHTDWRLPTIFELYDLSYLVDLFKNGDCHFEIEGNFWADENDGEGMVGAWEISDQCEPERHYFSKNKGYVRAVRK